MAKLYLRGRQDPIFIENKDALILKNKWLAKDYNEDEKLEVGEHLFKASDIKSIEGVLKQDQIISRYDLNVPEHKKIIMEFEKDYNEWKSKNKDKRVEEWWQEQEVIQIRDVRLNTYVVKNPRLMNTIQAKWSAFQIVRYEREEAERKNPDNFKPLFKKNGLQEKKQGDTQVKN